MKNLAVKCLKCGIAMSAPNHCPSCDKGMVEMPGADSKTGQVSRKGECSKTDEDSTDEHLTNKDSKTYEDTT